MHLTQRVFRHYSKSLLRMRRAIAAAVSPTLWLRSMAAACGVALWLMALAACSSPTDADDAAQQAALHYYEMLTDGRESDFIGGLTMADSLPDDYRQQLTIATMQYVSDMRRLHGALTGVSASNTPQQPCGNDMVNTFLMLNFADSTSEEVVVTMKRVDEKWMMHYSGL